MAHMNEDAYSMEFFGRVVDEFRERIEPKDRHFVESWEAAYGSTDCHIWAKHSETDPEGCIRIEFLPDFGWYLLVRCQGRVTAEAFDVEAHQEAVDMIQSHMEGKNEG